ncbi:hypothetical protein [Metapseudomonas otitidis]|uniref:hypothetical protein n=1 Tax=Metapseudomonas otitidis TaxID=319939 RepID=UPI000D1A9FA4|nr:hypothetical protein [Pseudomonas otitidis]
MKLMFTGIFLTASAAPAALAVGFYSFSRFNAGLPGAIELAATTSAFLLGVATFVFLGGLVTKAKVHPVPIANSDAWAAKQ